MNPTAPSNPLASLLMSLGGGLQPQGLQGASLLTDGEGDFASLMSQLSGNGLTNGLLADGTSPLFSGKNPLPTALTDGQNLPLTIDTDMNLDTDGLALGVTGDAELLMMQIETPPPIRYVPSSFNDTAFSDDGVLDDSLDNELSDEKLTDGRVGAALFFAGPALPTATVIEQAPANLSADPLAAMRQTALKERLQGRNADAQSIAVDQAAVDAESINDDGYSPPTLLEEDRRLREYLSAGTSSMSSLVSPQPPVAINTQQSALAAAINDAQLPAAVLDGEVASDATSDVELSADVELKSMSERLQTQLRERLEFGQDRREWGGALGARIATMVADNIQHARIQLDPPELGSLEIKLQVMHDQASVQVHAQNHQVREVLEANSHRLRDALQGQGLTLAQFDVSEQASGGNAGGQSDGNGPSGNEAEWLATEDSEDLNSPVVRETNNLLDTFA
ncbi:flagellar hook-length control protein FliK [Thalassolituus sp.]|jgi:flagellar hook-length control protein FliK|uniref:flagellar hook-length control protein FliK n=1 Tax=Thalassolituus sp. TaxID=2030822 RepID=UPI002A83432E|nr:flagellar hook-length control protein FliK [Thalassolituus sp.]|tara:strand:- start:7493 stop:8845 length:1353 start_codon:yes stop_codon:yes gene_type:complete